MNVDLVVILTALNLEYQAVRRKLTELSPYAHSKGTKFETGSLPGGAGRVALGLVGKGNHASAVLAERAMKEFQPIALMFVGVAGGLRRSVKLGDVVIATHVYAYHGGTSEDDGLKARPRVWEAAHELDQTARHVAMKGFWTRGLPDGETAPDVHFGPVAAGEVVQDSAVSANARWIRQTYNDALAIEMEAAGVAQAGHLNRSPVAIVRGISDRADGTKAASDGANWQPRAAAHAAAFAVALAGELVQTRPVSPATAENGRAQTGVMIGTNTNVAYPNAHVGVQAGYIHGSVSVVQGADPAPDLHAQLATLRAGLRAARAAGEVDDGTCDAAEDELAVVTESLRDDPSGTPQTMLALKRLRGLLGDVAGLAAAVAAMITAVRTLS